MKPSIEPEEGTGMEPSFRTEGNKKDSWGKGIGKEKERL